MKIVHLSEFGDSLTTKPLAKAIRDKTNFSEGVEFSFSGVNKVTMDFLEELLGVLIVQFGEKLFNQKIQWSGTNFEIEKALRELVESKKSSGQAYEH